jgi:hypothetical protein
MQLFQSWEAFLRVSPGLDRRPFAPGRSNPGLSDTILSGLGMMRGQQQILQVGRCSELRSQVQLREILEILVLTDGFWRAMVTRDQRPEIRDQRSEASDR